MSFQRVILTPEQLRHFKPNFPPLNPHPLQSVLDVTQPTSHVDAEFGFAVAIDLMGLDAALMFVKAAPTVLTAWLRLIENHGWNPGLRESDLQVSLILNAIKIVAASSGSHALKREERAYELIRQMTPNNPTLEQSLIQSLILNKAMDLPWTVNVPMPPKGSTDVFGTWTGKSGE